MSTEKIIKNQAKKSLSGNWVMVIAAVIFFCVILIAADAVVSLLLVITGMIDTGEKIELPVQILYTVINGIPFLAVFLLSPIINGIFKMFSNIALYGKTEITDMFFYFKYFGRYCRAFVQNILLMALYMILSYGFDVYHYAVLVIGNDLQDIGEFDILTLILASSMVITVIIKILIYMIFIHYQLIAYATFDNIPIHKCVFGMYGFSLRHLGATIKLILSFIGWIALCFFVVPAFYVLPYLMASMSTSAKWLFSLDRDRGLLC